MGGHGAHVRYKKYNGSAQVHLSWTDDVTRYEKDEEDKPLLLLISSLKIELPIF